jgi:XTP/dITP diphosphohydrolase
MRLLLATRNAHKLREFCRLLPGVFTARYAGEHATDAENLAKLAAEAPAGSDLRYVCVIAHVDPDGAEHLFEGTTTGTVAAAARGEGGFGYDPLFVPDDGPGDGRTMAELPDADKDAISHRGRAARALEEWLRR